MATHRGYYYEGSGKGKGERKKACFDCSNYYYYYYYYHYLPTTTAVLETASLSM